MGGIKNYMYIRNLRFIKIIANDLHSNDLTKPRSIRHVDCERKIYINVTIEFFPLLYLMSGQIKFDMNNDTFV